MKYYPINQIYIGTEDIIRKNILLIQTVPGMIFKTGEICINGILGIINNWQYIAVGEFNTENAAIAHFVQINNATLYFFPLDNLENQHTIDGDVISVYGVGDHDPMSEWNIRDWLYTTQVETYGITADTEDNELEEIAQEIIEEGREEGVWFTGGLKSIVHYLIEQRDLLE